MDVIIFIFRVILEIFYLINFKSLQIQSQFLNSLQITLSSFFHMEKSSEKLIGTNRPTQNPFNNLLSEVQIKLNQPKSLKKIQNYVLQIDPNIDRQCSHIPESPTFAIHNSQVLEINSRKIINKTHVINAPLPTKNSSDSIQEKENKEVIYQWIMGYMEKRQILGQHWEHSLKQKRTNLLNYSLQRIKGYSQNINDSNQQKLINLWNILAQFQARRIKECFIVLKQYYKDDILFGLSKTLQQQNDGQIMFKVDSDCGLSIQSRPLQKQRANMDKSSGTFSNLTKNKKAGQSLEASEDLSALILNYNKVPFAQELNRSNPNISKNKNTQKLIDSTKQIGQISINTKKKLDSNRKLSEGGSNNDLPLESKKNLINNKKEKEGRKNNEQLINESTPLTITMIIKQFETQKDQQHNQKEIAGNRIIKKNVVKFNNNCSRQLPNKYPLCNEINQIGRKQNKAILPPRPNDNPKRSVSMQTNQKFYNLIVENTQNNVPQINSKKIISNHEYYPQEGRQNIRFMKQTLPIYQQKVRPKSATPKITFTFSNNPFGQVQQANTNYQQIAKKQDHISQIIANSGYNVEHDPILESIVNPAPQNNYQQKLIKNKSTKLMVISPSSRRLQSPKKGNAQGKLNLGQREHIQNIILPSFDDYGGQNSQKLMKSNPSAKLIVNNNQIIYKDLYHRSTAQNTIFPLSPRQSGVNCCAKDRNRIKSPKDKIFVTFGNKYHN